MARWVPASKHENRFGWSGLFCLCPVDALQLGHLAEELQHFEVVRGSKGRVLDSCGEVVQRHARGQSLWCLVSPNDGYSRRITNNLDHEGKGASNRSNGGDRREQGEQEGQVKGRENRGGMADQFC